MQVLMPKYDLELQNTVILYLVILLVNSYDDVLSYIYCSVFLVHHTIVVSMLTLRYEGLTRQVPGWCSLGHF